MSDALELAKRIARCEDRIVERNVNLADIRALAREVLRLHSALAAAREDTLEEAANICASISDDYINDELAHVAAMCCKVILERKDGAKAHTDAAPVTNAATQQSGEDDVSELIRRLESNQAHVCDNEWGRDFDASRLVVHALKHRCDGTPPSQEGHAPGVAASAAPVAAGARLRPFGVSRTFDRDTVLLVSFNRKPSDDELRDFHEMIAGRLDAHRAGVREGKTAAAETCSHLAFLCHTHDEYGKGREKGMLDCATEIERALVAEPEDGNGNG